MELQQLISSIINELIDTKTSVSSPLFKTKVFAQRSQNATLLEWVNDELTGYPGTASEALPSYRKHVGNLKGTYSNGHRQFQNAMVPLDGIGDETQRIVKTVYFQQSISALELLKVNPENKAIALELDSSMLNLFTKYWQASGHPYFVLHSAKKIISIGAVEETLTNVRSKLLDFMFKIEEEYGHVTTIEDLRKERNQIINFMQKTITANGDGNIINTGDNANISASINITKGSKEELVKCLIDNGVSKKDAHELENIIDVEQPDITHGTFGQNVNQWIKNMLGKALDGTWKIGIGTAGNILATAIKNYYGM